MSRWRNTGEYATTGKIGYVTGRDISGGSSVTTNCLGVTSSANSIVLISDKNIRLSCGSSSSDYYIYLDGIVRPDGIQISYGGDWHSLADYIKRTIKNSISATANLESGAVSFSFS